MTPTKALIDAAEEMLLGAKHEGDHCGEQDDEGRCLECVHTFDRRKEALQAAISSAKAAEEGVETHNLIESAKRVIREKANCGDDCTLENCAYFDLWASTVAAEEK